MRKTHSAINFLTPQFCILTPQFCTAKAKLKLGRALSTHRDPTQFHHQTTKTVRNFSKTSNRNCCTAAPPRLARTRRARHPNRPAIPRLGRCSSAAGQSPHDLSAGHPVLAASRPSSLQQFSKVIDAGTLIIQHIRIRFIFIFTFIFNIFVFTSTRVHVELPLLPLRLQDTTINLMYKSGIFLQTLSL